MDTPSYRSDLEETVLRLMSDANARRVVPDPRAMRYQQLGDECIPQPMTETDFSSAIYRHARVSDAMQQRLEHDWYSGPSLVQSFGAICRSRSHKRAIAYRPVIRVTKEIVKDVESGQDKPFDITYYDTSRYLTYDEVWTKVENFSRALREYGLVRNDKVAIFLETCWEWMISAYGVWAQSMVLVTVYATLGAEALKEAFQETSCGAIVTGAAQVPLLVKHMRNGDIPSAVIIYLGSRLDGVDTTGVRVVQWDDFVADGSLSAYGPTLADKPEDLALIMYTSGTTGSPKGVMHTHGSMASGVNALGDRLNELVGPLEPNEAYVAALPLAHIFEFAVTTIFITRGALIGFGHPRTLLGTYARPHGDLEEFKPVLLIGVPRIFDNYKKTVEALLAPRGSLERKIFDHAFASRLKYMREGMETPFWNEVVFAPFRKMIGGRNRCLFGGGGPISAPTQTFMSVVFGHFIQGWGLTETIGNGGKQLVGDLEPLCIGPPEKSVEVKLVDTEDYTHKDIPEPRGEVYLRGPFVFKGYYKKEAETKEVLTEDGWFRTGDIGAIADRGRLRIVSRIKSLAKNSKGEYVPMEVLESLYAHHPVCVPNGVCVVVHPHRNYICAIALTQEGKAMKYAKERGIDGEWPEILKNPAFVKEVTEGFREIARNTGRSSHEVVRFVRVLSDVWTPENDILTAASKLKRRVIAERYAEVIRELFVE